MTKLDWQANIESLADRVSNEYGEAVAASAFARVGATCFDDLNPSDYESVFSDLMLMDSDC